MIGLVFSEIVLFLAAGLIGFAAGYRLRAEAAKVHEAAAQRDLEVMRRAISEAQVRRARGG